MKQQISSSINPVGTLAFGINKLLEYLFHIHSIQGWGNLGFPHCSPSHFVFSYLFLVIPDAWLRHFYHAFGDESRRSAPAATACLCISSLTSSASLSVLLLFFTKCAVDDDAPITAPCHRGRGRTAANPPQKDKVSARSVFRAFWKLHLCGDAFEDQHPVSQTLGGCC